ncbi:MAG: CoA transferase [Promethearchaeota archaeon]
MQIEKVLSQIKVVELGHFISAPICGLILADQGADVIKIRNPTVATENSFDPIIDAILERGKTILEIDLNVNVEKEILMDILTKADVVIDNYKPNWLEKYNINIEEIRKNKNPRLIYCKISAFPQGDPRSKYIGYEAIAGMAGFLYEKVLKKPHYHDFSIGSVISGILSTIGIVAALITREKYGISQNINTNLYESDIFAQILQVMLFTGVPRSFLGLKMAATPFMGAWECKDGEYIYVHITKPEHNYGVIEKIKQIGFQQEINQLNAIMSDETRKDPTQVKSVAEAKKIIALMKKIYKQKTADEWEEILGKEYCVIKIRTLEEWIKEVEKNHMSDVIQFKDPILNDLKSPGPITTVFSIKNNEKLDKNKINSINLNSINSDEYLKKFNGFGKKILKIKEKGILKEIFKDNIQEDNLSRINLNNSKHSNVAASNIKPLEGIKVLDVSRIIAGPFCARILAELGADVISIQSPTRLDWALAFHVLFNVGKKSVTINFKDPNDKQRLYELIKNYKPDVFIQNYRSLEFAQSIRMDFDTIKELAPGIVYGYLNAYGIVGDWEFKPAFEQVIQAVSGVQKSFAKGGKPRLFPYPILDLGAGLMGSFGILLALYDKVRNKKMKNNKSNNNIGIIEDKDSYFVTTHMTLMAMYLQIIEFAEFQRIKMLNSAENFQINALISKDPIISNIFRIKHSSIGFVARRSDIIRFLKNIKIPNRLNDEINRISERIKDFYVFFNQSPKDFPNSNSIANNCNYAQILDENNEINKSINKILSTLFKKQRYSTLESKIRKISMENKIGIMKRHKIKKLFKYQQKYPAITKPIGIKKEFDGVGKLTYLRLPLHLFKTPIVDLKPAPIRGNDTIEILSKYCSSLPASNGIIEYPKNTPLLKWLWNFIVWGLFAIRIGNV